VQVGALVNVVRGPLRGAQVGTVNYAGNAAAGAQVGVVNVAGDDGRGAQIGTVNVARQLAGAQIGVVNVAGHVKGLQLGVVHVADDIDGVPLGVLSFVRHGYNHLAVWGSDTSYSNVGVKFGSRYMYTLLGVGTTDRRDDGRGAVMTLHAGL